MSPRLVNLDPSMHQRVQDLLPWYVMESLGGEDRDLVDEHVATCLICQRDVEWHCQLRAAHDEDVPPFDVERALASVRSRLQQAGSGRRLPSTPRTSWASWATWVLAAQFAMIAFLVVAAWLPQRTAPETYRAMGDAATASLSSRLLVVFAAQVTEQEMRRVLQNSGARIVDGPTSTDAYVLQVPPQRAKEVLLALRAEHAVALAESLDQDIPQ